MKRAFVYKDEKSYKFWWIDYSDCIFAVNYGKYGSIGKFELKEFDTKEDCQKEVEKLICSKMKKGYVEDENFNFTDRVVIPRHHIRDSLNILMMKYIIRMAMKILHSEVMKGMIR